MGTILLLAISVAGQPRPNILLLVSDDQRRDSIAALGNPDIKTPHLDRLVRDGFTFGQAYCMGSREGAVCRPSRAMLMSGRTLFDAPVDLERSPTLPQVLGANGYTTFATGKWHNGKPSCGRSFDRAKAVFFGGMCDHDKVPVQDMPAAGQWSAPRVENGKFSSELFADAMIEFLDDDSREEPFFAYVGFSAPHDPRMPPPPYTLDPAKIALPKNFSPEHPFDNGELRIRDELLAPFPRTPRIVRQHLADYYGMIAHLDGQIGRILEALDRHGLSETTIVIFTSDHGLAVGSHGLLGKQNLYEHSMGTPLVVRGPAVPRGKSTDSLVYLFDLFPTICEWTKTPVPAEVTGQSLEGIVDGRQATVRDSIFGAYKDVQRSVRDTRWKLIRYPRIDRTQLFDLAVDPLETEDRSGDPQLQPVVARLLERLQRWQVELGDDCPLSPVPDAERKAAAALTLGEENG